MFDVNVKIPRLLVVGSRQGSLGRAVVEAAYASPASVGQTLTAGIESHESYNMDIRSVRDVRSVLEDYMPTHVVCTAGFNAYAAGEGEKREDNLTYWRMMLAETMDINCFGVLTMARLWATLQTQVTGRMPSNGRHFVAISSNSAHIARTNSAAYCASKAALSMGIRCLAREEARVGMKSALYVYEPGWLSGSPMSVEISGDKEEGAFHRIPSHRGISVTGLAETILNGLLADWNIMNGSCIRLDGGEQ